MPGPATVAPAAAGLGQNLATGIYPVDSAQGPEDNRFP